MIHTMGKQISSLLRSAGKHWVHVLFFALGIAILMIYNAFGNTVVNDTWWQLRGGQELWEGTFSFYDPHNWTVPGAFWPAHELGFQWILYGLWKLAGDSFILMAFLNIVLVISSLFLLIPPKALRERLGLRFNALVPIAVFLMGFTLLGFVQIRAQGFSLFFFALAIHLIIARKPYWIPVMMFFWTWIHGSVVIGVALMGIATVATIIHWLLRPRERKRFKLALHFSIAGVLTLVSTCLSPLGFGLWAYFVKSLGFGSSNISEWQPITDNPNLVLYWSLVTGAGLIAALVVYRKARRSWEYWFFIVFGAFLAYYSFDVLRVYANYAIFVTPLVLVALMMIPEGVGKGIRARKLKHDSLSARGERVVGVLVLALSLAIIGGSAPFAVSTSRDILDSGSIDPFEGEIHEALHSDLCRDHLWNEYESGAYLLWFEPDIPVSIDSRFDLYPEWLTDIAGATGDLSTSTKKLNKFMEEQGTRCFLILRSDDAVEMEKRGMEVLGESSLMVLFRVEEGGIPGV